MPQPRDQIVSDTAAVGKNATSLMEIEKNATEFEPSNTDSGFLSSSNLTTSELDIKSAPDSGVINTEDDEKVAEPCLETVPETANYMRFDSGVDVGLSETFSSLSLKCSPHLNDLSGSCKSTAKTTCPNEEIIPKIITASPNPNASFANITWEYYFQQDNDGDMALHLAVIHGFVEAVHTLVRLAPHQELLDVRNDTCQSPLHLAVLTKQPELTRLLVVAGARQTIRDSHGETPLHLACYQGDMPCLKALTTPVSEKEVQDLHLQYDNVVHERIDLNEWNYDGETCVHIAALHGHIDVLRHFVELGADINAREGKAGYTALHLAISKGHSRLINFLLTECPKLKIETPAYSRLTAYQIASDPSIKSILARNGANTVFDSDSDSSYSEDDSDNDNEMSYSSRYESSSGMVINAISA